jgi:hypothetical protein
MCIANGISRFPKPYLKLCFHEWVHLYRSYVLVVSQADLNSRRNRIVLAISMGIGLGVAMVGGWLYYKLNPVVTHSLKAPVETFS